MRHLPFILAGLLIAVSGNALCAPRVLVSIKPLHALAATVMEGVGEPGLLIDGAHSPHDFRLKPSDARQIQAADLFIWTGPALESKLTRPVQNLAEPDKVMTVLKLTLPAQLASRAAGVWEEKPAHHEHGGGVDPHIWLNPDNAIAVVRAVAEKLAALDTANARRYSDNAERTVERIRKTDRRLKDRLADLGNRPFITLHDNLQYFERHYKLQGIGTLAVDAHGVHGARRVVRLRDVLKIKSVTCLFHEPQASPKLLKLLTEDTGARAITVDPLGTGIPADKDSYYRLLDELAADMADCLEGTAPSP